MVSFAPSMPSTWNHSLILQPTTRRQSRCFGCASGGSHNDLGGTVQFYSIKMLLNQQHFSYKPVPRSVGQNLPSSRFPISRLHTQKKTLIQLQQKKNTQIPDPFWPQSMFVFSHMRLGHLFHIDVVVRGERMEARKMTSLDSGTKAPDPRCSQSLRRTPRMFEYACSGCLSTCTHHTNPSHQFPSAIWAQLVCRHLVRKEQLE